MAPTVIHLRSETKPLEHRSALTPSTAKALLDAGYVVNIERSPVRIFSDDEFSAIGATLVPEHSWVDTSKETIILGLKELPEEDFPLHHSHVQFAHCYKGQTGWAKTLSRFSRGGGTLYDLEFLTHPSGQRVAAFGYHAGYSGAALALLNWSHQLTSAGEPLPSVSSYPNDRELVSTVKVSIEKALPKNDNKLPTVLVIGSLGRCGSGAVDLAKTVGLPEENVMKWDMAETAKGGPFSEITTSDVFINCIYLTQPIPPFVTRESLSVPERNLTVVCDVSCDPNNPHNPVPIYEDWTTFDKPTLPVSGVEGKPLSVISIDHLPSLLPREASESFSTALLPSLLELDKRDEARVWTEIRDLFNKKVSELPS
ncbi:MAG: Saccharopine dehydrogenase [Stictis urceolatum]|nr:Saccharopine dehydrogenase [Stictis urceolata]